mgnify:CR=1 FL=1
MTIPVRWMPIREFPLDDPRTWEALAAEVRGFCLPSGVQGVFAGPLIESLRHEVQEGQAIVVARADSERDRQPRRSNLRLKVQAGRLRSITSRQDAAALVATDLVVLPASFMSVAGQVDVETGTVPIRRWLERAAVDGHVRVLSTETNRSHWYQDVRDAADVQAAEKKLFNSLKGEFEGFVVDRFFNRKVSRWFTRIFLAAGLSPNAITILATLVGWSRPPALASGPTAPASLPRYCSNWRRSSIAAMVKWPGSRSPNRRSGPGSILRWTMWCIWRSLPALPWVLPARGWERRCVGSSCPGFGSGPWKWAFVLARHPGAKD